MSALLQPLADRQFQNSLAFVQALFGSANAGLAVRFWNGITWSPAPGTPVRFTLVLQHAGALRRMFDSPTELSLGEAYIYGDYDIEGDVESAVHVGKELMRMPRSVKERLRVAALLGRLPEAGPRPGQRAPRLRGRLHSRGRDRSAIRYHYDVANEFYQLFLDSRMIYSAGRFSTSDASLEDAQRGKLDHICRSLELQPGERFLDIGCGWGGLVLHAAQHFGVQALGITLSERQAELARERIRDAGLEDRCRVELCDYRDVAGAGSFDKISSIGMVEHVGAAQLSGYFQAVWRLLRNGGLFLNSGIARPVFEPAHREGSFTATYVFPDGELETMHETLHAAESAGFEIRALENAREDYCRTLRHWVHRLEMRANEARSITDDVTYRIWRLYMAGSAERFQGGELYLMIALLRKARRE